MAKRRDFWSGAIFGLIAGAIAGVLLAPKSGQETRETLKAGAKRWAGDANDKAQKLQRQLGAKVEELKEVAKDLGDQAKAESQTLIARAEVLKQDLRSSTKTLTEAGRAAKVETIANVRQMVDEGATLMHELEDATKRLLGQAKQRWRERPSGDAVARVEELEQNGHNDD